MPNNKNIILAAERVKELVEGKTVKVLPTKSIGQGLAAAVLFNEGAEADELFGEMQDAVAHALTLEVTTASRDASLDGLEVSAGDYIGLVNGELKITAPRPDVCVMQMLEAADNDDYDIATLFYSPAVEQEEAEGLVARLGERFPDLELELHPGAPDLYYYVMALE